MEQAKQTIEDRFFQEVGGRTLRNLILAYATFNKYTYFSSKDVQEGLKVDGHNYSLDNIDKELELLTEEKNLIPRTYRLNLENAPVKNFLEIMKKY